MTGRTKIEGNLYNPVIPEGAVDISRRGRWGNPHVVGPKRICQRCGLLHNRHEAIYLFAQDLRGGRLRFTVEDVRRELAGKTLACWCGEHEACHGDVLIRVIEEVDHDG